MPHARCVRKHHHVMLDTLTVLCTDQRICSLTNNPTEAKQQIRWFRSKEEKPILTLWTGAKAYARGNGWWCIIGYAQDLSDILPIEVSFRGEGA